MKVYRSVCTYIWNDDKFPYASDDCQLVWFHIFTNPLSSPLGLFRASIAGLAEDKNRNGTWSLARYRKAFGEALREGFLKVDTKALLIAFPKYFSPDYKCNHPQSPNVLLSWGERFNDLPRSPLKTECYHSLKALVEGMGEAFHEAFTKAFHEALPKGSPNTDPDSLSLIPDPDSLLLNPESQKKKRIKTSGATQDFAPPIDGIATWNSYSEAYLSRYGKEPVRNAMVNGQLKQFVKRIGSVEAPQVAAFYLTHNDQWYVKKRHPVGLLLHDAEGLQTQWATGIKATTNEAKNIESQDNAREQVKRVETLLKGGL